MNIVRSTILSRFPEILFGMSTNREGASKGKFGLNLSYHVNDKAEDVFENRRRFFSTIGITEDVVACTTQKHGTTIVSVQKAGVCDNCDALFTKERNIFLSISVADCTPVMLYDSKNNIVAAIHAGWRGTAAKIVEKTILQLQKEFNSNPSEIVAFIGPSAGKCCYEVGKEVASQFPAQCASEKTSGKYLLDVKFANKIQLLECGVVNSNIEVNQDCTIHNELYHSFRRDGKESGRMFAVIGIKN